MRICKVNGCNNKRLSTDYCQKHYIKYKKYGDPSGGVEYELHGYKGTQIYETWQGMLKRCNQPNYHAYHRYGGRGIKVCDRWLHSFKAFYEDMGDKPFPKAQLDRIDNDGNYESDNCHWVKPLENIRKRSTTKLSMDKAKNIRLLYKEGKTLVYLGKMYNVTPENIGSIVRGLTWKEQ